MPQDPHADPDTRHACDVLLTRGATETQLTPRRDRGKEGLPQATYEPEHGPRLDFEHFLRERDYARGIGKRPRM